MRFIKSERMELKLDLILMGLFPSSWAGAATNPGDVAIHSVKPGDLFNCERLGC